MSKLIKLNVKNTRSIESNKGLELNSKKTESMIITRKTSIPKCEIKIKENTIKQANSFKYLGTSDGRNHQEIKSRIAQAKASFQQMKSIMTNIKMSIVVRKRILEAFIEPVLLHGCEAWTIEERMKRSLETSEMWFLRRMMRIPWTAKKTNEKVLTEAQTTRQLMTKIRKRQAKFVVIRRNQLEHLVTTGKFDGKRGRGRPKEKMLDSLADWMNIGKPSEMIREMSCRVGWRSLIAHASRHGMKKKSKSRGFEHKTTTKRLCENLAGGGEGGRGRRYINLHTTPLPTHTHTYTPEQCVGGDCKDV